LGSCSSDEKSVQNADAHFCYGKPYNSRLGRFFCYSERKIGCQNSVNVSTRMMGYITSMKAEEQNVRAGTVIGKH
jgi:hypothetical protein